MTRTRFVASLIAAAFTTALTFAGSGTFEITSHTIDAGGGASTSSSYELAGTIGQPDAHAMTSATYDLQGGFWMGGVIENCPADLANNDGLINVFDLFVVLNNWGTSGTGADLAPANNVVDVFDLFVLLGAWGACD